MEARSYYEISRQFKLHSNTSQITEIFSATPAISQA